MITVVSERSNYSLLLLTRIIRTLMVTRQHIDMLVTRYFTAINIIVLYVTDVTDQYSNIRFLTANVLPLCCNCKLMINNNISLLAKIKASIWEHPQGNVISNLCHRECFLYFLLN